MAGENPDATLSVEDAVAQLAVPQAEEPATAETPVEAAEPEAPEPEQAPEEQPKAAEEQPEPELAPIDPPKSWSAADQEKFAALPRDAQEIIAAREADRDRTVQKTLSEKDRATKQANEQAAQAAAEFRQKAEQVMPEALRRLNDLEAVDLVALNQKDPNLAQQILLEREQARSDYAKLQADIQAAQQAEQKAHLARLAEELPNVVPDLVDPEKGAERVNAVGRFLQAQGIPLENVLSASAVELKLAYNAMRWEESQDKARQMTATRPPTQSPPTRPVRPASSAPTSSQQSAVEAAKARLARSGDVDDAVALLQARRKT